MNTIEQITNIINGITYCLKEDSCKSGCLQCRQGLRSVVSAFVNNHQTIQLVLPAFPAKSANRDKTLSELPDLGERLALNRLAAMLNNIKAVYSPGAKLVICSDGSVFNDLVHVTDGEVTAYQCSLQKLCRQLQLTDIEFYQLSDHYQHIPNHEKRLRLIKEYGASLEAIKSNVKTLQDEQLTFNGMHRFIYEDYQYFYPQLSNNKIRKLAKHVAYQMIQRSHAWSSLVASKFPNAIRLSIHPHYCNQNKYAIKLIEGDDHWATPWHNVILKTAEGYRLVKRQCALTLGAKLRQTTMMEAHYAL